MGEEEGRVSSIFCHKGGKRGGGKGSSKDKPPRKGDGSSADAASVYLSDYISWEGGGGGMWTVPPPSF